MNQGIKFHFGTNEHMMSNSSADPSTITTDVYAKYCFTPTGKAGQYYIQFIGTGQYIAGFAGIGPQVPYANYPELKSSYAYDLIYVGRNSFRFHPADAEEFAICWTTNPNLGGTYDDNWIQFKRSDPDNGFCQDYWLEKMADDQTLTVPWDGYIIDVFLHHTLGHGRRC